MIVKLLRFEVRRESLPEALAAVRAFVDEVGRKEGGTASYKAYQEKEPPTRFALMGAFRTPSADQYHHGTAWRKAFLAKVQPLCVAPPDVVEMTEVEPAAR